MLFCSGMCVLALQLKSMVGTDKNLFNDRVYHEPMHVVEVNIFNHDVRNDK